MKLRINHLPEHPKEAALLGTFMILACAFTFYWKVQHCRFGPRSTTVRAASADQARDGSDGYWSLALLGLGRI
jgi:hypothetical protein